MADFGVTDEGYIPKPTAVIEEEIEGSYESLVGFTVDWDPDAFLGAMKLTVARRLNALELTQQALSDSKSFNNARGLTLDDFGQSRLTARLGEIHTRVTCTLTSESDTTTVVPVPTGKIVRGGGDDGRQQWRTIEDVEIPAGGGTVDVVVEAVDAGAISANPAEITEIVTPVDGWASVTNGSEITVGRAVEADGPYRRRQAQATARSGSATVEAIRAKVLNVTGVLACNVLENEELTTQTVEGVSMEGKAIAVYVQPSTLTTEEQENVVKAIYGKGGKAGGIKTLGSIAAAVVGADGLSKTIRYSFFTEITADLAWTVVLAPGYALADVTPDIQAIGVSYFAELLGGDDVFRLDLTTRVGNEVPGVTAATVTINTFNADLSILGSQIAVLGTNTVST